MNKKRLNLNVFEKHRYVKNACLITAITAGLVGSGIGSNILNPSFYSNVAYAASAMAAEDINTNKNGNNYWYQSNLREWLNSNQSTVEYSCQKPDSTHTYGQNLRCSSLFFIVRYSLFTCSNAWPKSSSRSSGSSRPTFTRTRSSVTPALAFSAALEWTKIVDQGWMTSVRASPILETLSA